MEQEKKQENYTAIELSKSGKRKAVNEWRRLSKHELANPDALFSEIADRADLWWACWHGYCSALAG